MTSPVEIMSFGYGHGPAPEAHATFDVRHHFRDPHVDPALRHLTAADEEIVHAVMNTPGIAQLVDAIVAAAHAFRCGPSAGVVPIAIGCVGGRHRSAAIAIEVAAILGFDRVPVMVVHRDMDRPVVERGDAS
jgi:RNase adaptor protein for sRNA GlmZ degradation